MPPLHPEPWDFPASRSTTRSTPPAGAQPVGRSGIYKVKQLSDGRAGLRLLPGTAPDREACAGLTVRLWASVDVIHLTIGGARVKSVADLARLAARRMQPDRPAAASGERVGVGRSTRPLNRAVGSPNLPLPVSGAQ